MKEQDQAALTGTVKFYDRHLFISTPDEDWPVRIEEGNGYVPLLAQLIDRSAREAGLKVKLTAFYDPDQGARPRILSFPDRVEYRVDVERLDQWVDEFFGAAAESPCFVPTQLHGNWAFVCSHGTRDERCGVCGPPLVEAFRTAFDKTEESEETFVYACSHVGGHIYAGNVLIYPGGDWYGHVTPEVVPHLVDRHLGRGEVLWEYWRGRTWLTPEEQCNLEGSSGA